MCLPPLRLPLILLPLSVSFSQARVNFGSVLHLFGGANHREWVSLCTQPVYKSCSQWNQWLTGSCWDGRRCHRKTKKKCQCVRVKIQHLLPFFCFCIWFSLYSAIFNLFVDDVWKKSADLFAELKQIKLIKMETIGDRHLCSLYHYDLILEGYFQVDNLQTFCSFQSFSFSTLFPIYFLFYAAGRMICLPAVGRTI